MNRIAESARKVMTVRVIEGQVRTPILWVVGGLIIAGGLVWGGPKLYSRRVLAKADEQLKRGLAAVAADSMDSYRYWLVKDEKGCRALISAYYQVRSAERLRWASESCLVNGKEIPETYLGLAGARELVGRDAEALNILASATQKFDKVPDIYYGLAQLLRRNKKDDEALVAYARAVERASQNAPMILEAADYAAGLQRWGDAKQFAGLLKSAETDNPELKLFLARVYQKAGEPSVAQGLVAQARELIAKKPEIQGALEQAYADVLGGEGGKAGKGRGLATSPAR